MLSETLGIVATGFTVGRTWPQFLRIVIHKEIQGVSLGTWSLAVVNHMSWLMYGLLTNVPVFIASNLLAGLGCAATVSVLHSWQRTAQIAAGTALASLAVFLLGDKVFLIVIICTSLTMVLPQLYTVLRSPADGVSTIAWSISALSSISWIAWAIAVHRPFVVFAHYVMLPAALIIAARAIHAHRTTKIIDVTNDAVATN